MYIAAVHLTALGYRAAAHFIKYHIATNSMGTGRVPLKVNSKGKKNLECMEEMHSFMQCFSVSTYVDTLPTSARRWLPALAILTAVTVTSAVGNRWRRTVCQLQDRTRQLCCCCCELAVICLHFFFGVQRELPLSNTHVRNVRLVTGMQAKKGRQRTSINYHLGRLSRLITKSGK